MSRSRSTVDADSVFAFVLMLALAVLVASVLILRHAATEAARIQRTHGARAPWSRYLALALVGLLGSLALSALLFLVRPIAAFAPWPAVAGFLVWCVTLIGIDARANGELLAPWRRRRGA